MTEDLTFTAAEEDRWQQYDELATRAYGHPVRDITDLRPHADLRVATRHGRVVAGGLGLLVHQYFGGRPVPSACLGSGCVAPEERGEHLAARMTAERLRPLQEQGAVISTISTSSTGYARRLGYEAPVPVLAWAIATDDLRRSFPSGDLDVDHSDPTHTHDLQRALARLWNGPVERPAWWSGWKQRKSNLTTYRFRTPGQGPTGLLTLTTRRRERHGMNLVVHDFWAADHRTALAMLAFLGRHNTRAQTIEFRRGALPPYPTLLHHLHHHRPNAESWHPWMLRILNIPEAIRLRGWPGDLHATLPIEMDNGRGSADHYALQLQDGKAELVPTRVATQVRLTPGQLAVWYAGGYRSAIAARMAGVQAVSDHALESLIQATVQFEPWLPDHF